MKQSKAWGVFHDGEALVFFIKMTKDQVWGDLIKKYFAGSKDAGFLRRAAEMAGYEVKRITITWEET